MINSKNQKETFYPIMENSAIITSQPITTGIGVYSYNLFDLGLFSELALFTYKKTNPEGFTFSLIPHHNIILNEFYVFSSLFFVSDWGKYVSNKCVVHFAAPDWFHLAKYNKNSYGTIHDFFILTWPFTYTLPKRFYFRNELKYISKLKKVTVYSDYVKKQVNERYPNVQVERIHLWTDESFKPHEKNEARKKLGLPSNKIILLNVSSSEKRKNTFLLPQIMNMLGDQFLLIRIGQSVHIKNEFKKNNFKFFNNLPKYIMPLYYNAVDPNDVEEWVNAIIKASNRKPDWSDIGNYYRKERAFEEYKKFYDLI